MENRPEPGRAVEIRPGIRRILAPNPSPMTFWGTNSYLVGDGPLALIDPGPDDDTHLAALLAAIGGADLTAILVTHAHRDHSALAPRLAAKTGAPVLGFGPPEAGRSPAMTRLAATGKAGGGAGVDKGFRPDRPLADGDTIPLGPIRLETVHTPGHFPGHLSFSLGETLFSGDHLMGWSTTLISPPEGDVAAFLASCARLLARPETLYLPGHGTPVATPRARLEELVAHRHAREAQILDALTHGPATADTLAARIYTEIAPQLLPAAARNTLAHLVDLTERNRVAPEPALAFDASFRLL